MDVISFNGKKTKFGEQNNNSKNFEIEIGKFEIPVCINGVLSTLKGIQKLEFSVILI